MTPAPIPPPPHSNAPDPIELCRAWLAEAQAHDAIRYAHSATLSTLDGDSVDARIVLVHAIESSGFIFGSDSRSAKAQHIRQRPAAALTFYWEPLEKQIRIRGRVAFGTEQEGDETFDDRPRESRITAWASQQSREVASREVLERRFEQARARFDESQPIPRPDTWKAFRVIPERIEFWQARRYRLHDRQLFERGPNGGWASVTLEP